MPLVSPEEKRQREKRLKAKLNQGARQGDIRARGFTDVFHDPGLTPVVRHEVARWDDDTETVRILEQLQLGVHGSHAVHWGEAEFDVGRDDSTHLILLIRVLPVSAALRIGG